MVLGAKVETPVGLLIGVAVVWHLRRVGDPLLSLSTLGVPTYAVTVLWGR